MPETYTDEEIVHLYRRGRDDPHIIKKLCELAVLPQDKLIPILHAAGEALNISCSTRGRRAGTKVSRLSDNTWRQIIAARLKGVGFAEICDTFGTCKTTVQNWRREAKRLGILVPDRQISSGIQCIPDKKRKEVGQMEEMTSKELATAEMANREPSELFSAICSAVGELRRIKSSDSFCISYVDHKLSVEYAITVED